MALLLAARRSAAAFSTGGGLGLLSPSSAALRRGAGPAVVGALLPALGDDSRRRTQLTALFASKSGGAPADAPKGGSTAPPKAWGKNNARTGPKLYKRPRSQASLLRADRILANRGVASRRECRELISKGRICYVDPDASPDDTDASAREERRLPFVNVRAPSEKIPADARVFIDGVNELPGPVPLLLAYHKPRGVLSAMRDESPKFTKANGGKPRPHLGQRLEAAYPSYAKAGALHPVGRLDRDTSGLILFSSSGGVTHALLSPNSGVEKEYAATVEGAVRAGSEEEAALRELLSTGVETAEGTHTADLLDVEPAAAASPSAVAPPSEEVAGEDEDAATSSTPDAGGAKARWSSDGIDDPRAEDIDGGDTPDTVDAGLFVPAFGADEEEEFSEEDCFDGKDDDFHDKGNGDGGGGKPPPYSGPRTLIRLVVTEGKHRMVRRMLYNAGYPVAELRRDRHGAIALDDLAVGGWRAVNEREEGWARKLIEQGKKKGETKKKTKSSSGKSWGDKMEDAAKLAAKMEERAIERDRTEGKDQRGVSRAWGNKSRGGSKRRPASMRPKKK